MYIECRSYVLGLCWQTNKQSGGVVSALLENPGRLMIDRSVVSICFCSSISSFFLKNFQGGGCHFFRLVINKRTGWLCLFKTIFIFLKKWNFYQDKEKCSNLNLKFELYGFCFIFFFILTFHTALLICPNIFFSSCLSTPSYKNHLKLFQTWQFAIFSLCFNHPASQWQQFSSRFSLGLFFICS